MRSSSTPERLVTTRRVSFDAVIADLPRHFAADGDLVTSHVMAALSAVFPDGEDFFVRSVRAFRDQLTDPILARQVAGFIGQESMHGREHRALNARLGRLGYSTERVARFTRAGLRLRSRLLSATANLAATAALEHFTATLAELLLGDAEARRQCGHRGITDLFLWHALEESEHKAVAFDVYRAIGGSERTRTLTMNLVTAGFVLGTVVQVAVSLSLDPATYRRGILWASLRRFRHSPFVQRSVWRRLRDYNRRDFHPDDYDAGELVGRWRDELFGSAGALRPLLTIAATQGDGA